MDTNKYEKPSVTVDMLVFTIQGQELKIALVKRGIEPFKDMWALPGGFVKINESLDEAAKRELAQETGVENVYLEQLYTFGNPQRDPRTRVITVAYFALMPKQVDLLASTDVKEADWFVVDKLPTLAFDHQEILRVGIERLRNKIQYSNIVYGLLPEKFRLSELQRVYEIILGHNLDKRNFRKKMLATGLLHPTGEKDVDGAHRPAMLYKFKTREVVFFD